MGPPQNKSTYLPTRKCLESLYMSPKSSLCLQGCYPEVGLIGQQETHSRQYCMGTLHYVLWRNIMIKSFECQGGTPLSNKKPVPSSSTSPNSTSEWHFSQRSNLWSTYQLCLRPEGLSVENALSTRVNHDKTRDLSIETHCEHLKIIMVKTLKPDIRQLKHHAT